LIQSEFMLMMETPKKCRRSPQTSSPCSVADHLAEEREIHEVIKILERTDDFLKVEFRKGMVNKLISSRDDPAIALNIYAGNLQRGITAINAAAIIPIPAWMPGAAYPIAIDNFTSAVLQYAQTATNGGVTDNFCICPNSGPEAIGVSIRFSELNVDPFVMAIANAAGGSIGRIHGFYERKVIQIATNINLPRPGALPLPNIQAFL
jgi:hypothetical protein